MNKKTFIQKAAPLFMLLHPNCTNDIDKSIHYAVRFWGKLQEKGYGGQSHRDLNKDWYGSLTGKQRQRFDQFWDVFSLKKGKNGAAMRWHQMEQSGCEAEFERILGAAKKEAEKRQSLPVGSVPIMAQGWLNQMRWRDEGVISNAQKKQKQFDLKKQELLGQLQHAVSQQKNDTTGFWKKEQLRFEKMIKELDIKNG